jgi:hypothetical protein
MAIASCLCLVLACVGAIAAYNVSNSGDVTGVAWGMGLLLGMGAGALFLVGVILGAVALIKTREGRGVAWGMGILLGMVAGVVCLVGVILGAVALMPRE